LFSFIGADIRTVKRIYVLLVIHYKRIDNDDEALFTVHCPCREWLRGAQSGRQMGGFATDAESPGPGGGVRFRTASFGGEEDVQQVALFTLVIIMYYRVRP